MRRLRVAIIGLAAALSITSAGAQTYPSRPITVVVPFAAGGPADALARALGERMRTSLGQTVIIEKQPARRARSVSAASCAPRRTATRSASGTSARMWSTARSLRCRSTC